MTDDQLRTLVRDAVARHLGLSTVGTPTTQAAPVSVRTHASHARYALASGGDDGPGPCLIEPAVTCNHCGYCQSHGH